MASKTKSKSTVAGSVPGPAAAGKGAAPAAAAAAIKDPNVLYPPHDVFVPPPFPEARRLTGSAQALGVDSKPKSLRQALTRQWANKADAVRDLRATIIPPLPATQSNLAAAVTATLSVATSRANSKPASKPASRAPSTVRLNATSAGTTARRAAVAPPSKPAAPPAPSISRAPSMAGVKKPAKGADKKTAASPPPPPLPPPDPELARALAALAELSDTPRPKSRNGLTTPPVARPRSAKDMDALVPATAHTVDPDLRRRWDGMRAARQVWLESVRLELEGPLGHELGAPGEPMVLRSVSPIPRLADPLPDYPAPSIVDRHRAHMHAWYAAQLAPTARVLTAVVADFTRTAHAIIDGALARENQVHSHLAQELGELQADIASIVSRSDLDARLAIVRELVAQDVECADEATAGVSTAQEAASKRMSDAVAAFHATLDPDGYCENDNTERAIAQQFPRPIGAILARAADRLLVAAAAHVLRTRRDVEARVLDMQVRATQRFRDLVEPGVAAVRAAWPAARPKHVLETYMGVVCNKAWVAEIADACIAAIAPLARHGADHGIPGAAPAAAIETAKAQVAAATTAIITRTLESIATAGLYAVDALLACDLPSSGSTPAIDRGAMRTALQAQVPWADIEYFGRAVVRAVHADLDRLAAAGRVARRYLACVAEVASNVREVVEKGIGLLDRDLESSWHVHDTEVTGLYRRLDEAKAAMKACRDESKCERIFGGITELAEELEQVLTARQRHARVVIANTDEAQRQQLDAFQQQWDALLVGDHVDVDDLRAKVALMERMKRPAHHANAVRAPTQPFTNEVMLARLAENKPAKGASKGKDHRQPLVAPAQPQQQQPAQSTPGTAAATTMADAAPLNFSLVADLASSTTRLHTLLMRPITVLFAHVAAECAAYRRAYAEQREAAETALDAAVRAHQFRATHHAHRQQFHHEQAARLLRGEYVQRQLAIQADRQEARRAARDAETQIVALGARHRAAVEAAEQVLSAAVQAIATDAQGAGGSVVCAADLARLERRWGKVADEAVANAAGVMDAVQADWNALAAAWAAAAGSAAATEAGTSTPTSAAAGAAGGLFAAAQGHALDGPMTDLGVQFRDGHQRVAKARTRVKDVLAAAIAQVGQIRTELAVMAKTTTALTQARNRVRALVLADQQEHTKIMSEVAERLAALDAHQRGGDGGDALDAVARVAQVLIEAHAVVARRAALIAGCALPEPVVPFVKTLAQFLESTKGRNDRPSGSAGMLDVPARRRGSVSAGSSAKSSTTSSRAGSGRAPPASSTKRAGTASSKSTKSRESLKETWLRTWHADITAIQDQYAVRRTWYQVQSWVVMDALALAALAHAATDTMTAHVDAHITACNAELNKWLTSTLRVHVHVLVQHVMENLHRRLAADWKLATEAWAVAVCDNVARDVAHRRKGWAEFVESRTGLPAEFTGVDGAWKSRFNDENASWIRDTLEGLVVAPNVDKCSELIDRHRRLVVYVVHVLAPLTLLDNASSGTDVVVMVPAALVPLCDPHARIATESALTVTLHSEAANLAAWIAESERRFREQVETDRTAAVRELRVWADGWVRAMTLLAEDCWG
ncbi:hypothetical protein AMAG_19895 [Allomyces macrogynus ATCC 38327]|uniref:Uncharacterized protein n=1 Tax=Allomyces macrogynus (strain ATCC 38327) TaxID=578462 RepID=A0A0L0T340_ALLM3|nr:hypothetical protein AMAG_19895 [Allomyces macrogynus ATCC 38327]|eukprot:KNE69273.1 hypothetical protein AMAG_19895 [Allomyces macrogynus ATCC 38327]